MLSISDPAYASWLGISTLNYAGVTITERTALSVPAMWRAVNLVAGAIASLPARAILVNEDGTRERVSSWLDAPGGPDGPTAFEFWETVMLHLMVHGNAFLIHIRNGAGAVIGLQIIHPLAVAVFLEPTTLLKTYHVTLEDGRVIVLDSTALLHIPAICSDGIRGISLVEQCKNSFGTSIAADRAAAKMFADGALVAGLVTPEEEDLEEGEAETIKQGLNAKVAGWENAGALAVVNRRLKFTPWTQTHEQGQFIESRAFQIEEVARMTGVPPHLLMQTEKQTSWGTGVAEQNRGLSRLTLGPWAARIEQRISRLLSGTKRMEFDFTGLERPTPEQEVDLLVKQVAGGIITQNEARAVRNLPPVTGGDTLVAPTAGADTTGV